MKMKMNSGYIAECGLLLALAVIAAYVEMLIPVDLMLPGIKAGLANCVILFILYRMGPLQAMMISLLRTMIMAFAFTSPAVLIYSFSGALISIIIMTALSKSKAFSVYGVSMAGGVSHNITQLIAASYFMLSSGSSLSDLLTYYLPILIFSGIAAGIFNAIIADILIKRIPQKKTG